MLQSSWTRLSLSVLFLFSIHALVAAESLHARASTVPAPISFAPDENWDGIDGSWSSFTLRVGTPAQIVRVFASWMSYQTWVVHPEGCAAGSTFDVCASARGGIFSINQSSTWETVGLYSLAIEENLGLDGNAYYGWDVVGLGGIGEGGPTLQNTTVGDFAVTDFYLGLFGLNPKPTNWSSFEDSSPSYMTQLKEQNKIPSVSFGYTAGAPYRFTGVLASLTLGGYDASRYEPNDVEFTFAFDNTRDIVVGIQSITTGTTESEVQLLRDPIYALIDATVPQIWLPLEACQAFEAEFGLIYDETTELYLVNSSLHDALLARNANITFTLGQGLSGGSTVNITLPYASFDLTASPPYQGLENSTTYFPLQRAGNDSEYTIGRTFMQEAYITVDYERAKFNVSQCTWVQNAETNILPISAAEASDTSNYSGNTANTTTSTTTTSSSSSMPTGAIAGAAVGAVAILALIAGLLIWHFRRRRQHARQLAAEFGGSNSDASSSTEDVTIMDKKSLVIPKAELQGSSAFADTKDLLSPGASSLASPNTPSSQYGTYSSSGGTLVNPQTPNGESSASEADGMQVYEMMGDVPERPLADGREITEKDMMKHREAQINGVDPNRQENQSPDSREAVARERKLLPADSVRPLREEEGGAKRFSFQPADDTTLS